MRYLPAARRWKRVRFSIFLCFFLRIRLRRFLTSEPIRNATLQVTQRSPYIRQARRYREARDRPGSFNGRTAVFGAAYRGSNPLPGTRVGTVEKTTDREVRA